ncbi:MAG: ATP-binding protein [Saprospirales bacterium]|nr:ATP-binding protein [Saprospirales bacterium]
MEDSKSIPLPNRYPGPQPFEEADAPVFYGRDREIDALTERLSVQRHVLLHAASGIGKSSLLNAGLLPRLKASGSRVFKFSFGARNKENPQIPLETAYRHLRLPDEPLNYLDKLLFEENSLWYLLKKQQWHSLGRPDSNALLDAGEHELFLILDQFEELFTYLPEEIEAFKRSFIRCLIHPNSDSVSGRIPGKAKHSGCPQRTGGRIAPPPYATSGSVRHPQRSHGVTRRVDR